MLTKWLCFNIDETEEEFSTRLANNLENLILKEGPETVKYYLYIFWYWKNRCYTFTYVSKNISCLCPFQIAAFIAEPVMGAGGVILPPKTYFEKVIYNSMWHKFFFMNHDS